MNTNTSKGDDDEQQKGSASDPRRLYLETLLQQLRSPAKVMRHHLTNQRQNTMLGLAAETGVRDVLRSVLPGRFGVTSGFLCHPEGGLVVPPRGKDVSPQTDVLIYDASRACPLYKAANDVGFIAARDAVGIIEVKDRAEGELALGPGHDEPGALAHLARVARYARGAFRAVVLLRGKGLKKKGTHASVHEQCEGNIAAGFEAPHAIYCAEKNYVAVYEYTTNGLHFVQHDDRDGALALADFLRLAASFYAAQSLSASSISLGLRPATGPAGQSLSFLQLRDRPPLPSLWNKLVSLPLAEGDISSIDNRLKRFVEKKRDVEFFCVPTTGKDAQGHFTSGVALVARWKEAGESKDAMAASFFVMTHEEALTCTELSGASRPPWVIAHERPEAYLQRVCDRIARLHDPFADEAGRRKGYHVHHCHVAASSCDGCAGGQRLNLRAPWRPAPRG